MISAMSDYMVFKENHIYSLFMFLINSSQLKYADNINIGHISLMRNKKAIHSTSFENWRDYCQKHLPFG
jgi:hypothetical protein